MPAILAAFLIASLLAAGSVAGPPPAAADPGSGVTLSSLEVENRTKPLGIDVPAPRFSWIIESGERDVEQDSYRVRVARTIAELSSAPTWDTGVVDSNESVGIEYEGAPLTPMTDYVWQVDVATSSGEAQAGSTFATGLFDSEDWGGSAWIGNARAEATGELEMRFDGAKWIWTPEESTSTAPAEDRAFRRTIVSPEGRSAVNAEIMITADDSFTLWLNGDLLGRTEGAVNEWQSSKLYEADPDPSRNVLAVRTTNGPNSPAGLLAVVRLTFDDGSSQTLTTDESWKAVKEIPTDFQRTDFDDADWPPAAVQATYGSGPWGSGVRPPVPDPAPAPLLRREFTVDGTVETARMYIAAGGYVNASLNGEAISDEVLAPGFTDYDDHVQYTVTDVTDRLQGGVNAIGMQLGRGFYGMTNPNVWWWERAPWHDDPVVRAILRITYADGTVSEVVTDGDWQIHDGPVVIDDLYGGETYDARRVIPGFDTSGFDSSSWDGASIVSGPKGILINQHQQPIRVMEELPALSITEADEGIYVVKFPRVIAGTVRFTAQGEAGTTIRAQYGEKLLPNGRPNFSNNGGFGNGFQTDRFILAGTGGPETWAGNFSYKGFQYIEVSGWPGDEAPPLEAFTALVMHTDAAETGSFETSNDLMNRTHRAAVDTLKNNIHGIPTDTPMFEKNGWTGDAAVGTEMFLLNLDTQNLFEKWVGDMNDSRDEEGAPYVIAPSSSDWGAWGVAPPWHSAYILIPAWLNQYGGSPRVMEQYYDGMKQYVDLEYGRSPGGLVPNSRLGDWVSPEASPAGGNAPEDIRVSATAYLYAMLTSMERTAGQLGKSDDAAVFAERAAVVKGAFNEEFLDVDGGYYRGVGDRGYRQTHNVLALAFGLAPDDEMAERVAASIAEDVRAKGDTLNTGSLGTKYLLPVLTEYGYEDLAYRVAVQTDYPSWGYQIENGATSMWEHWSLDARSYGHYFLGTVEDWFYHYVGGIRSSEDTGYRDITIAPAVTDQLDWAKTETHTPFGPVGTDWEKDGDLLRLRAHVPVGSTATVHLPAANVWAVTEGGMSLAQADGVRDVTAADGAVLVTVGSGDYDFEVDPAGALVGAVLTALDALDADAESARADGALNQVQYDRLLGFTTAARVEAEKALTTIDVAAPTTAAEHLAAVIGQMDDVEGWLPELVTDEETHRLLSERSETVRATAGDAITTLLGITVAADLDAPAYKPGTTGVVHTSVTNGDHAEIADVTVTVLGLADDWQADDEIGVADALAPGQTSSASLEFVAPSGQLPGDVSVRSHLGYDFAGVTVGVDTPLTITVDSPVTMPSVTLEPSSVAPGESTMLRATIRNEGMVPAAGHLEVSTPEGWITPLPTTNHRVPAGEEVEVEVPVYVPFGTDHAPASHSITASFVFDDVEFARGEADLTVELASVVESPDGYDHVDLGDDASEAAHDLTASARSGTSVEAGLTRRYSHQLDPNSYFEFDTAVVAGEPFRLRVIETYDKPQTKKYMIMVDGVDVTERLFSHTGGEGTETYEVLIPAEYAQDSTVRIRFQFGSDITYYDPSIADVWTLPVPADTIAPDVVATTDPAAGNPTSGWFTSSPVKVSIAGQDDRGGEVQIESAVGDDALDSHVGPIVLARDGEHAVTYRGTDDAGNVSPTEAISVKIDTVAPTVVATLSEDFEDGIANRTGTVHLEAGDATSGVAGISYRVNGGDWQSGDAIHLEEAGEFIVDYFATDVAGNTSDFESVVATIVIPDETAPVVMASIAGDQENGWYRDGARVVLNATDDDSGVASIQYRIGSGDWQDYDGPIALAEGATIVRYRASDLAGNVSIEGSISVQIDTTAPTVWAWLAPTGRVAAVATDEGSGPERLEYSIDGGSTWHDSLSGLAERGSSPDPVAIRAVDRAGNASDVLEVTPTVTAPSALELSPGELFLVEADGFDPGSTVSVEVGPEPTTALATVIADRVGVISAFGTVPSDITAGELILRQVTPEPGDGDSEDDGAASGGGDSGGADTGTDHGSDSDSGSADDTTGSDGEADDDDRVVIPIDPMPSTGAPVALSVTLVGMLLALGYLLVNRRQKTRGTAHALS